MRAQILDRPGSRLRSADIQVPEPLAGQLLLRVEACGVCRTDQHIVDGEIEGAKLPLVPGHEIVARVERCGPGVTRFSPGDRVGVPWLAWTCGECGPCLAGRENLCPKALFTGWTVDGGYAERTVADARYVFPLPDGPPASALAPLLCAGLIGYRSLRAAGPAEEVRSIGLYGFGAAAHLVAQVALFEGRDVFAFTRTGDTDAQEFARALGASWAGGSDERGPVVMDAAILFAPAGSLVPAALAAVRPGGTVVCAGIHMSDIPSFPYSLLRGERVVKSVANLTRKDGEEFFALLPRLGLRVETVPFPLEGANEALDWLREGRLRGAAVFDVQPGAEPRQAAVSAPQGP